MPSFFAALPLSTGDFAWAKMKTAMRSMLWLCVLVFVAAGAIAAIMGTTDSWAAMFETLRNRHGLLAATALIGLIPLSIAIFTLAGTANVVWIALIGRGWRIGVTVVTVVASGALLASGWSSAHPGQLLSIVRTLTDILPLLAAAKLAAVALLVYRVGSMQLYPWPRILFIVCSWIGAVAGLFALYWFFTPPGLASARVVLFTLILLMPVLGILAAPLALHWNRSR